MRGRRVARRTARRTTRRVMRRRMRRRMLVGGMVLLTVGGTAAAIKLSQRDADRIEQHTGAPLEELEDDELESAMQELNIQSQPLNDSDRTSLQGSTEAGGEESSAIQAEETSASYIEELKQLAELRDQGIITSEEFEAKKKQLLGL